MAVKRRRVIWTHEACSALEEAVSYVFEESPQAARSLLERSLETAASLDTLSKRGRTVPEPRDPAFREVFVGRYRLMYEVKASEVTVVTFLHGAGPDYS